MRPKLEDRLGFNLARSVAPPHRFMARFTCRKCHQHIDVAASDPLNPEVIAKRAAARGWKVDSHHASVTRCPACLVEAVARRKGEPLLKVVPPAPAVAAHPPISSTAPKEPAPMATPETKTPRGPTTEERIRIRNLLDKHFDDGAGCYLDDYSDQRVGEEARVPWAIVTRIREAAYGPIRVDPEMVAARAELAQLARDLKAAEESVHTILKALHDRVEAAAKRIAALEGKRAA